MFSLFRDQWIVSKGVREIAIMGEEDGLLMPSKREDLIKHILEFAREMQIATKGISGHEQVMIAAIAFFGIAFGPGALADANKWASEYANRHKQLDALAGCMETARKFVAAQ